MQATQTPPSPDPEATLAELALLLTPGLGPTRATRLVQRLGSPNEAANASEAAIREIKGIGPATAQSIRTQLTKSKDLAKQELQLAQQLNASIITIDHPRYPPLLANIPNPPRLLFVRGTLPQPSHLHAIAIVGSRRCTAYGIEQAERFASAFANAGIAVASGGARGIDTAAHRAACRANGTTIAVLGSGLANHYPKENQPLFQHIATNNGAIISELPCNTHPAAEHFPARNRIISGLSLAVLVIEAPERSGALITAREANENQGRDVMVVPGRIDSPASAGSNALIKDGAALIASPAEAIANCESIARHQYLGTAQHLMPTPNTNPNHQTTPQPAANQPNTNNLFNPTRHTRAKAPTTHPNLSATAKQILEAIDAGTNTDPDAIARATSIPPHQVRAELTTLELTGQVTRSGTQFSRTT